MTRVIGSPLQYSSMYSLQYKNVDANVFAGKCGTENIRVTEICNL
jgi:hypothetical protein